MSIIRRLCVEPILIFFFTEVDSIKNMIKADIRE